MRCPGLQWPIDGRRVVGVARDGAGRWVSRPVDRIDGHGGAVLATGRGPAATVRAACRLAADGAQGWVAATRGWGGRGEGGEAWGKGSSGERQTGDDHKLAAPPGMSMPAVATVQAMPTSASGSFPHPGSRN